MITASSLIALVEARGAKETVGQLLEVGAASDTAGAKLKSMAMSGLLVAGAAAIGFGVASVKMAGDFEQSTNLLITSAGEVPKNIDMIRKGLLQMSVDTATPVDELVKGMFNVESAGYRGASALLVEKAAAEGARVENANLADTTGILVTAMHDFHEPASQATDVMNSFRMAASMGVMHLDDLNAALKNVLPIASTAGVKLTDVEAAISTMSLAGDKGASAGTHLSQMLTYLLAPSSKATGALKEVGLTTQKISDEMKVSLPGTVQMITDAVGEKFPVGSAKYIAALSAIVGGNKSMKAMLELSGISLKTFTDDAKQLAPTMKANSTAVDGWTTVQGNFNFKMDAAKNAVEALMISVGEKLLPVVGQLADAVTPLIADFSTWIGSLSQFGDEVAKATAPVKQIQEYLAPLPDAFDRGTGAIHTISNALHPLTDTFDHAKSVIGATTVATKPLVDSFDRATVIIPKVTTFVTKAKDAVSPLVTLFLYWKPVLQDTVTTLETLAGDVATFASGIFDAADKSGAFQSALQFVHDLLPQVDGFLVTLGSDIDKEVLPPLESLTTNVGYVISDFVTWADKSGTATSAIADLGTAVGLTASVVGTLVQGLSDLIGWFDQDAPQAYILAGTVTAVGLAFAGLKVANTIAGFQQMFAQFTDGESILSKLASTLKGNVASAFDDFTTKQFPNLKKAMNATGQAADEVVASEEAIGETAKGDMASGVAQGSAEADADLEDIWFSATQAEQAEASVGTTAETTMAEGVTAGSVESEASLSGITAAADEAAIAEETVGTTAETKMAGGVEAGAASSKGAMSGLGGMLGGLIITLGIMGNQLAYNATAGKDFVSQFKQGDWLGSLEHFIALGTPGGQLASTIDVFTQLAQKIGLVSSSAQDMSKKTTTAVTTMKTNTVQSATEMAQGITGEYSWMKNESLSTVQGFSSSATAILGKLGSDGTRIMQSLDKSTQLYWNDIAQYIDMKSNQAAMEANQNLGKIHVNGQTYGNINNIGNRNANDSSNSLPGHASGGFTTPGWSIMNERGGEMVKLPGGSYVIPHDMSMNMMNSSGGGNQPIHVHVHIADQEFTYLTNAVMDSAARQTRLRYGSRRY